MMMLHGKAALQREVLDACDATGMKVLMDISQFVPLIGGPNTTENWSNFRAVIEDVRAHPATLGYYLCDDCVRVKWTLFHQVFNIYVLGDFG